MLKTSDFDYVLPDELIAQAPLEKRDNSRLMVVNVKNEAISHHRFSDLPAFLSPKDLIIMNDTKVIKARLFAKRETGAHIEIFLVHPQDENHWTVLLKPAKRVQEGETLMIGDDLRCTIVTKQSKPGQHLVQFHSSQPLEAAFDQYGSTPLPPYIAASQGEGANHYHERYQTVVAKNSGAVAAPTAGLHFTPELIDTLATQGTELDTVTLHVGLGTFAPITAEHIEDHTMHEELYHISEDTRTRILNAKNNDSSIVAVGTTVTRTLESAWQNGDLLTGWQATQHYIYPGYTFKCVDKLITNFHLPKSSLLFLVSALAGKALMEKAYQEAIKERYRFFSFGDAMLILP